MKTIFIDLYPVNYLWHSRRRLYHTRVLTRRENLNKSVFSSFLIPGVNKNTIKEHICHVSAEGTWATQVEVIATATAFEVPVYFCKPSSSSSDDCDKYIWNVIKPLKYSEIKLLDLPELNEDILLKPDHFELYYYENSPYDVII